MPKKVLLDPAQRRLQSFKLIYQHLEHFQALMEDGRLDFSGVVPIDAGEEVCLRDLLVGLPELSSVQRQAFGLVCLRGYTDADAQAELDGAAEHAALALVSMVASYDAKQMGSWHPSTSSVEPATTPRGLMNTVTKLHDVVRGGLEGIRRDILAQIENLKTGLAQVDAILRVGAPGPVSPDRGKPRLEDVAHKLAAEALSEEAS